MKTKFFLMVSLSIVSTFVSSCSNQQIDDSLHNSSKQELNEASSQEFTNLCSSIDNLNSNYATLEKTTTRGRATKWGGRFFSAVVDGIGGYIAGPIAGWVVGPLVSWAFEEHWERCNKELTQNHNNMIDMKKIDLEIPSKTYVPNSNVITMKDSIGYFHNKILDEIAIKDKKYTLLDNNDVDYKTLYEDCLNTANKLGANIAPISNNDKEKYLVLADDIVKSFEKCAKDSISLEKAFKNINDSYIKKFGNNQKIELTEIIQKKIAPVISNMDDEEEIIKYADKLNNIYNENNINHELKDCIKTATDVTINSKLFWDRANIKIKK